MKNTVQGFTLLEVLVALGIAATSLIAMYSLAGQLGSQSAALDLRQWAAWCADNRMIVAALETPAPPIGQTEHSCLQGGQRFTVVQSLSPTANARMRRIELSVYQNLSGGGSRSERLGFLATVLPVQGAKP